MIRAAVVGAAGYLGGELLRLLLAHPRVDVAGALSTSSAGRPVSGVHPNLRGRTELTLRPADTDDQEYDVMFVARPQTTSMGLVPELLRRTACLIDLGADFRLRDAAAFERYYGQPHTAPCLAATFVPGLPELARDRLATADRISVPGCMATAAVLALLPLVDAGLVDGDVVVDGRIGSSGSGAGAHAMNLHAVRSGALRVFAPIGHRHEAEITQATGLSVTMHATGVEAVRGAQVVCHAPLKDTVTELDLRHLFRERYRLEPFVRIVTQHHGPFRMPEPKILAGSNFCDVGFAAGSRTPAAVVIAALDNLVKGGAGNAVQSLNVRMGWPETLGLDFVGLHPV